MGSSEATSRCLKGPQYPEWLPHIQGSCRVVLLRKLLQSGVGLWVCGLCYTDVNENEILHCTNTNYMYNYKVTVVEHLPSN